MTNFIQNITNLWRLKSAVNKTISSENPTHLKEFLLKNPVYINKTAEVAISRSSSEPWNCIWLCLSLIQLENDRAIKILEDILESNFAGWKRINHECIQIILNFLDNNNQTELYLKYANLFDVKDVAIPIERMSLKQFDNWYKEQIAGKTNLLKVNDRIIKFIEKITFNEIPAEAAQTGILNAFEAGLQLWNHSLTEESLKIIRNCLLVDRNLIEMSHLKIISGQLKDMIEQTREQISIENREEFTDRTLERKLSTEYIPGIPSGVVRSAEILKSFPSEEWIENLIYAWIYISKYIRIAVHKNRRKQISPDLAMAGNSIIKALGACVAQSTKKVVLESDSSQMKKISCALQDSIEYRDQLADRFRERIEEYKKLSPEDQNKESKLEEEIRKLDQEISTLDQKNENMDDDLQREVPPAQLLLLVLNNSQDYPDIMRQAAARALYLLMKAEKFNLGDKKKILEHLRLAIIDDQWDDQKLNEGIKNILEIESGLQNEVFEKCKEYLVEKSENQLSELIQNECDDNKYEKLITWLDETSSSITQDFAEHPVYVLPDASLLEVEIAISDGLEWMIDIVEKNRDSETEVNTKNQLLQTVKLIDEFLPQATRFFALYPLRLMNLDHHRKMLGKYTQKKCDIVFWTRYTPPAWKPGMSPDDAGEVHQRYLALDDRSTPNAMGIYYRLFENPHLVLPVIYHEFLHFGGTFGRPEYAIQNESEVWIREIIFMQYLIAKLAPTEDDDIPDYEQEIADAISRLKLPGLGLQIQYDFSDKNILPIFCDMIERIYGKQKSNQEAIKEAEIQIRFDNRNIQLMNRTHDKKLNWHPEIEWPYLNSEQTQQLTLDYMSIMINDMMTKHRIDLDEFGQILNEQNIQNYLLAWQHYAKREQAMNVFNQTWPLKDIETTEIVQSILNRFNISGISEKDIISYVLKNLGKIGGER